MKRKSFTQIDGRRLQVREDNVTGLYEGEDGDYYVGILHFHVSKSRGIVGIVDIIEITKRSYQRHQVKQRD